MRLAFTKKSYDLKTSLITIAILTCLIGCKHAEAIQNTKPGSTFEIQWLSTNGSNIVNEGGIPIVLRGIDVERAGYGEWVNGVSDKLAADGHCSLIKNDELNKALFTDNDISLLAALQPRVVRYQLYYELFDKRNLYRSENLAKVLYDIQELNKNKIYVIVTLMLAPGLDSVNEGYEDEKHGDDRIESIFENEVYWEQFVEFWEYMAENLKDIPGVAGYEIINEPRLPSDKSGGLQEYTRKFHEVCRKIRKIDPRHIIFVPEIHSREANPGELYWSNDNSDFIEDNGEQGIVWGDNQFIKLTPEFNNIVYVFHFYEPWDFVSTGNDDSYNVEAIDNTITKKVDWAYKVGKAPLIVTEYGVSRKQPTYKRLNWLEDVHSIFDKHGISSTYFLYKSEIGPWDDPEIIFGLYGEFFTLDEAMEINEDNYLFQGNALEAAKNAGFNLLFEKYLWNNGNVKKVSLLDNEPLWNTFHKYFTQ